MTNYEVYDSTNTLLDSVVDVDFTHEFENKADQATVTFLDRSQFSSLGNDEKIEIRRADDGVVEFLGRVIDRDTTNKEIDIKQKYTDLMNYEIDGRIFYYKDSGQVMEDILTEQIDSRGTEIAENCSDLTNITSDVPDFDLCNFRQLPVERFGTDMVFLGFPTSTSGNEFIVDFDNVTFSGDTFYSMQIRNIVNNISGIFDVTVNYVDQNGNNYVWELGEIDGVNTNVLTAEDAVNSEIPNNLDTTNDQGTLRLVINLNGKLVEARAIAIDAILVTSVDTTTRTNDFDAVNIPNSGRTIKRRFTDSASEAIYKILEEENKKLIVTENNVVTVKERGSSDASLEITDQTNMVDFDIDTDSDKIYNRVVVQGDNNIVVERKSQSSINFFNFTKTLKIRDQSIITPSDAVDKANSLLSKHAWRDTEITVKMPDNSAVRNTSVGDQIYVNYDNVSGYFVVDSINKTSGDWVEIQIEAESVNL